MAPTPVVSKNPNSDEAVRNAVHEAYERTDFRKEVSGDGAVVKYTDRFLDYPQLQARLSALPDSVRTVSFKFADKVCDAEDKEETLTRRRNNDDNSIGGWVGIRASVADAHLGKDVIIAGSALVRSAYVADQAIIEGRSNISNCVLFDKAHLLENASVHGPAVGTVILRGNVKLTSELPILHASSAVIIVINSEMELGKYCLDYETKMEALRRHQIEKLEHRVNGNHNGNHGAYGGRTL